MMMRERDSDMEVITQLQNQIQEGEFSYKFTPGSTSQRLEKSYRDQTMKSAQSFHHNLLTEDAE
jgi:hypothetical protein